MANKDLKSIKFPGLDDIYTIPEGTQGQDGITPTIGDNGNWFLGATDTGKPSRGATGPQGPKGETGADGKTPVKGADYFTAEDKAELVSDVLAALPTWMGGSY